MQETKYNKYLVFLVKAAFLNLKYSSLGSTNFYAITNDRCIFIVRYPVNPLSRMGWWNRVFDFYHLPFDNTF